MSNLLEVNQLSVTFEGKTRVQAVRDISFSVEKGKVTAVVGESGCGKSVTFRAVMGMIRSPGKVSENSHIYFQGEDLLSYTEKEWCAYRGKQCALIFQDALAALNPTMKIGKQLEEAIQLHQKMKKKERREACVKILEEVGLTNPRQRLEQYPYQLSGGMRQRVMIAMALLMKPSLLIADEPTTALDVTVQADILDLLKRIQKDRDMSVVFITHDFGIVAEIAENIIVMYAGSIVDIGTAEQIFYHAGHPYTKALLRAVPKLESKKKEKLEFIQGDPLKADEELEGCPFISRCTKKIGCCKMRMPMLSEIEKGHKVACWNLERD